MAITRNQTNTAKVDNANVFDVAMLSDVTSGSLVVLSMLRWRSGGNTTVLPTQLSQLSGTATIDTPLFHYWNTQNVNQRHGIWSFLVTGSGSLTMRVTHPTTAFFGFMSIAEYIGGVNWTPARAYAITRNTGVGTTPSAAALSTPNEGGILYGFMHCSLGTLQSVTENANYSLMSEWEDGPNGEVHSIMDRTSAGAITDTASWTVGASSTWYTAHLLFREGGIFPARMVV